MNNPNGSRQPPDELRDIHDRVDSLKKTVDQLEAAMQALSRSEARYRALWEAVPDPIFRCTRDGIIVGFKPAQQFRPFAPVDRFLGKPFRDVLPAATAQVMQQAIDRAFATRQAQVIEYRLPFEDGPRDYEARIVVCAEEEVLVIVRDFTARKQSEEAQRKAHEMLEERVRERTAELTKLVAQLEQEMTERKRIETVLKREEELLRQMLAMQDRDRKLLAYEIHDGLTQHLTGALLLLQGFRELADKDPKEAWRAFDAGLRSLSQGVVESRRLIGGLRPPILDESGIVAAIENLVIEARQPGGPKIEFASDVEFHRLEPALENAIFRIVQECLTNACRHSKSERVLVRLAQRGDRIRVEVRDWGVGFDPNAVRGVHFGLQGIRERARLLSGQAVVWSAPGQGSQILVDLPLIESTSDPPSLDDSGERSMPVAHA